MRSDFMKFAGINNERIIQRCRICRLWRPKSRGHIVVHSRREQSMKRVLFYDYEKTALKMLPDVGIKLSSLPDLRRPVFICGKCWKKSFVPVAEEYLIRIRSSLERDIIEGNKLDPEQLNFLRDMGDLGYPDAVIALAELYKSCCNTGNRSGEDVLMAVYSILESIHEGDTANHFNASVYKKIYPVLKELIYEKSGHFRSDTWLMSIVREYFNFGISKYINPYL